MPTSYTTRTPVSTSYSTRSLVTTTYTGRLQGSYLCDVLGRRIKTIAGDYIIVGDRNGTLPFNTTKYTVRTPV